MPPAPINSNPRLSLNCGVQISKYYILNNRTMGNTEIKNNGLCDIYIETEFPFYNSGSVVRGVVFLNTAQQLFNQSLYLRIQGKERCLWYQGSSFNRKRYEGVHQFYHIDFVIAKFDVPVEPGCYAWPFTINLSENLPGSFESQLNPEIFIRYQLGCYLIDYTNPLRSQYHWRPLILREPFRLNPIPLEGEMTTSPSSCLCRGSGLTQIHAVLSKNVCFIGQSVGIHVDINNTEGATPVTAVNIALVQNVFVTSNSGAVRTFKKPLHVIRTDGCDPLSVNSYDISLQIPIGPILDSTAIGTIVGNYYTVQLTALAGGWFSSNQPFVNCPLFIISQDPFLPNIDTIYSPMQTFQPPPFFFKQNTQLPIMNFVNA